MKSREDIYLGYISGDTSVPLGHLPKPVTRTDYYLAKMCGVDVSLPNPVTREDYYFKKICENGVGIGGSMFKGVLCKIETLTGIYIDPTP